jgi:hypothetical protein
MTEFKFIKIFVPVFFALLFVKTGFSCSMYKITVNGKTMVGNNEDSWGRDAKLWFEQGKNGKYGTVCVGYARNQPLPDGAMNEHGLAFDAFTMAHKDNIPEKDPDKNDFAYSHLKTIIQQYKTVDEVYAFLDKLNLHILNGSPLFNGGMFLFVDKTGKYLVVEAHKMTFGHDDKFVLANFSIADTKDLMTIKMERYCKGVEFLNNKNLETSITFCSALSDTMCVNRTKVGNGTLYTNIYDLDEGLIHLYFFHDFGRRVTFNLQDELKKGDHSYSFTELFPENQKYQKFLAYKTPQNNKYIFIFIVGCGLLFSCSFVFYLISFFKTSNFAQKYFKLVMAGISLAFGVYSFILLRNEGIFYFPSPYGHGMPIIISLTAYLPFGLLLGIVPMIIMMVKFLQQKEVSRFTKWLIVTNNFAYMVLIGLFAYWNLFDIFN